MKTQFLGHTRFTVMAMFAVMLGSMLFTFTACSTMEGAGKDIERAGEKIQEKAK